MTRDEIIGLAKRAGFQKRFVSNSEWMMLGGDVFRFAKMVAEREREACAQLCEAMSWPRCVDCYYAKDDAADECAAAIRARGETK